MFGVEKVKWWIYQVVKMCDYMFSRFDTISACDGQTDRQTSCNSIVRAVHASRGKTILA